MPELLPPAPEELHAAALDYVAAGYGVIPLHSVDRHGVCDCGKKAQCRDAGKHPRIYQWQHRAARDPQTVDEYWTHYPLANIGIVTGEESGVWVADVDVHKGGGPTWETLTADLPGVLTLVHTTPHGGRHHFYQWEPGAPRTGADVGGPGVDVRAAGGYVVAPPSVAGAGAYRCHNGYPVQRCPAALVTRLRQARGAAVSVDLSGLAGAAPVDPGDLGPALTKLMSEIPDEGTRSDRFYAIAARAYEDGLTEGQAVTLVAEMNTITGKWTGPDTHARVAADVRRTWAKKHAADNALYVPVPGLPPGLVIQPPMPVSDRPPEGRALFVPGHRGNLIDWVNLYDADDDDEPDWLYPGLFERGCTYVLASAPKMGKSLLLQDLSGRLVSGRDGEPIVTVGYADRENKLRQIRSRYRAMGYEAKELERLRYYSFPPIGAMDNPRHAQDFIRLLADDGVEMLVLDTVARYVDGKESDADTANALYNNLLAPLAQAGVCVIRLDHFGKNEKAGPRGSSAKVGDVDAAWELKKTSFGLDLVCTHDRTGNHTERFVLKRMEDPLFHIITPAEAPMGEEESDACDDSEEMDEPYVGVRIQRFHKGGVPGPGRPRTPDDPFIEALDRAGVPADSGKIATIHALRDLDMKVSDRRALRIIRVRKARAGVGT